MNDIRTPAPQASSATEGVPAPEERKDLKLRISPTMMALVFGGALVMDVVQNALGLGIIGELGLNEIIGSLSVLFFFPVIIYLVSDSSNPVIVYGMKKRDLPKLILMGATSLAETLPIATEFWSISIDVGGLLAAVYIEDLLNSGVLDQQMLGKMNPIVKSVGGLVSGRRSEIMAISKQSK